MLSVDEIVEVSAFNAQTAMGGNEGTFSPPDLYSDDMSYSQPFRPPLMLPPADFTSEEGVTIHLHYEEDNAGNLTLVQE